MNSEHQFDVTCDAMASLVDDFVDGRLDAAARTRVEAHLAACEACRALADDFRTMAGTAAALSPHKPRPEVWSRIAREVAAARPAPHAAPAAAFWTGWRVALAMAAVALVAVTASVVVLRMPLRPALAPQQPSAAAVHQSAQDTVQAVDEHLRIADEHYQKAITELEKLVATQQATLDPAVAATLDKNLGIIDKAVRESRDAIKAQPNNQIAQTSLFEALRQKVALLEDTIALINTMRKGDQAGAAKVIGGLSKS
jgi:hypothetical protein